MASASQIRSIYAAVAALEITVSASVAHGTTTPTVYDLAALPDFADSAKCPARLLLPLATTGSKASGQDHHFVALGTTTKLSWQVVDLLLWRPIEEGIGIASVAADLVEYCAQYVKKIRENRALGLGQVEIITASLEPDAWQYPPESDQWFWGVQVTLQINETLSG